MSAAGKSSVNGSSSVITISPFGGTENIDLKDVSPKIMVASNRAAPSASRPFGVSGFASFAAVRVLGRHPLGRVLEQDERLALVRPDGETEPADVVRDVLVAKGEQFVGVRRVDRRTGPVEQHRPSIAPPQRIDVLELGLGIAVPVPAGQQEELPVAVEGQWGDLPLDDERRRQAAGLKPEDLREDLPGSS